MKINILSDETINQIAAGEVIERPLSIVKELLENAIDAGSSSVSVEVREGGIAMVRITDNGIGIAREDVRNAFVRHATSKIRDARDLGSIQTLGFRGEALASIAAVSEVEMITKQPGALYATHYVINGGVEQELSEIGAPDGTTIIVRNLFKNVPARRKFLKSPQTESSRIQDIVEMEALAHPEVSFRYLQDGRQRLATLGNGSLMDVIYSIYGRDVTNQLISVNKAYQRSSFTGIPAVTVRGFVGRPQINRSNRNFEIYFVNSRYVKNPMISKAIEDGCRDFLMQHKFPFTVLRIDVNPEIVDVNVHPQKMEVRFSDGMLIYNCLVDSIHEALHQAELIVNTDLDAPVQEMPASSVKVTKETEPLTMQQELRASEALNKGFSEKESPDGTIPDGKAPDAAMASPSHTADANANAPRLPHVEPFETRREHLSGSQYEEALRPVLHPEAVPEQLEALGGSSGRFTYGDFDLTKAQEKPVQETLFSERFLSEKARLQHRIIGQVFDTYWLVEYGDKLYIIDQHAAHEKVNFERLMKRLKDKKPASQYLNPPILLNLSGEESSMLEKYQSYFEQMGYELSYLGGRDYSVSAVPTDLPEIGKKELLLEMLDDLTEETGMTTADSIYYKIASMSCKAAVKGNNRISLMEADALIDELLSLDNPYACPHGRPTIISMSKYELEKKFKRIV
ncbi:DNA mismatch repair endonuclease MutL [Oribacterium sp. HCP28S3_H8]|uniref:DNA mismatch repair endonuclease MutL n=1 Tax=Oribacterium sp. HCP28S3_H8 TaxID=3438945 RepID=UPI003F8A4A64